nr:MAG: hypothetical protein [Molluscum contagiosum virus]
MKRSSCSSLAACSAHTLRSSMGSSESMVSTSTSTSTASARVPVSRSRCSTLSLQNSP